MKQFLLFFIISILIVSCENNTEESKNDLDKTPLSGLTEGDRSLLKEDDIVLNDSTHIIYSPEGKVLNQEEILSQLMSGNYVPVPYVNAKGEKKAIVIRKATQEEIKSIKGASPEDEINKLKGRLSPVFEGVTIDDAKFSLQELKGKIIVLNFWFIECKPCLMEIPELNKVVKEYSNREDVVFLAIAENNKDDLINFLKSKPFHYTIVPDGNPISSVFGVESFPSHIVIDKEGYVQFTFTGYGPNTVGALRDQLDSMLGDV